MAAARSGKSALDAFLDGYVITNPDGPEIRPELQPAPDWRPFFFNIRSNEDILDFSGVQQVRDENGKVLRTKPNQPAHFSRTFRLLWIMLGMSVLLILGPLAMQGLRHSSPAARLVFGAALLAGLLATVHERLGHFELPFPYAGLVLVVAAFVIPGRKGVGELGLWRTPLFAIYFALLGAGYIMAMSGLIQRYVLFLGHQAYAFATVIGGLLVAAGIGSTLAGLGRHQPRKVMLLAVTTICAMLAALHYGIDPLFTQTADLERPARVAIGLAALLPLGIGLGAMFPTGLGIVQQRSPVFVPWAFGINGVFSVIGPSVVLPGAILYGFPTMTVSAGSLYVLALLVGLPLMRPSALAGPAAD
jgi:hypothetical protein